MEMKRERDRVILIPLREQDRSVASLQQLSGAPIERFGYHFNRWLLTAEGLPPVPPAEMQDRVEYNKRVLRMGWDTLRMYLGYIQDEAPNPEVVPELPELDLSVVGQNDAEKRLNEYEELLRQAQGLTDGSGNDVVWETPEGTWVRFNHVTSDRLLNQIDLAIPGDAASMRKYFKDRGFTVGPSTRVSSPLSRRVIRAQLIEGYRISDDDNEE